MPQRALAGTAWLSVVGVVLPADGLAAGFVAEAAGAWPRAPASAELTDWVPAVAGEGAEAEAGGSSLAGRGVSWGEGVSPGGGRGGPGRGPAPRCSPPGRPAGR